MRSGVLGVSTAVVAAGALYCGQSHLAAQATASSRPVDFVADVQPILRDHCYECHGPDKQMNGLRLDRRHAAMRGGTTAVIAPGVALSSRLYLRLIGTTYGHRMPLEEEVLTPAQIQTIKDWIDQGAAWPDAASGDVAPPPLDPVAVRAFAALRAGDRATFLSLVSGHPNLSTLRGPGGSTPLMAAALYGDAPLVKTLLDQGASPNVANHAGATPLMWAANDLAKATLLVDHGANVNARSDDGRFPLVIAASFAGNREVVALLLDHHANPSIQAPGAIAQVTAITEAAKQGDEASVRLLIERGSDVARAGFLALHFALRAECPGCVEAISSKLPRPLFSPALVLDAPPLGRAGATVSMLEHGADANARNPVGYPIIVLAAASAAAQVDAIKALLAHGADLAATGPNGETALDVARRHGHTAVVDALVEAGATASAPSIVPLAFAPAHSPRAAVLRSLPLLQHADVQFLQKAGCVSCHNNAQAAETIALARARGFTVDEAIAKGQRAKIGDYVDEWRERALQMQGIPGDSDTMSAILNGLAAEGYPADPSTDAIARFIRRQQMPDGRWRPFAHRPPIEDGDVKTTVEAVRALRTYAPPSERREADESIQRAGAWLAQVQPELTQDRAYRVLGLHDAHAGSRAIVEAGKQLAALQRADGGWSQLPTLDADAYSTGEALVALLESGAMRARDTVVQRGVQFLLRTQRADGSWFVARRAIPIQPYFDAGFPYGRDQFISAAATNWATQALISAAGQAPRGTAHHE
jgi:ankyrin repeat protein